MAPMDMREYAREVISELDRTLSAISPQDAEHLVDRILGAQQIFLAGAGRSGLAVRAFAMRLMHMGLGAYVVGETVTPGIKADDLLVIGSGSGATASLVTIFSDSRIGQLADSIVKIPAPTPKGEGAPQFASVQPMGSLFEQSLLIFFDIIVMRLMERKGLDSKTMFERHANLE
jgi:6-phospho-3-hexuloisomerase